MSIHAEIQQQIRAVIDGHSALDILSPTFIASEVLDTFGAPEEIHVHWLSFEHAKHMARRILAAKFDPDGEENEVYQGDMFSGLLQERYPIRRGPGEEPVYKPRTLMTVDELDWNIESLRKAAVARVRHADALQVYRDQVAQSAAA
jgi:hypothetical protein